MAKDWNLGKQQLAFVFKNTVAFGFDSSTITLNVGHSLCQIQTWCSILGYKSHTHECARASARAHTHLYITYPNMTMVYAWLPLFLRIKKLKTIYKKKKKNFALRKQNINTSQFDHSFLREATKISKHCCEIYIHPSTE